MDTTKIQRNKKKSQWASRYNDRLPHSTLENQPYEEGQEHRSSVSISAEDDANGRQANTELWRPEDESYYGANADAASQSTSKRWHYPANFDDAAITNGSGSKKKKKKDRWARTEDAYSISEEDNSKKKKKKKRSKSTTRDPDTYSRNSQDASEFPEDAEGGLYGRSSGRGELEGHGNSQAAVVPSGNDIFAHEF